MARIPDDQVEQVMREVTKSAEELSKELGVEFTKEQHEALIQLRVVNYQLTPTEEEEEKCGLL